MCPISPTAMLIYERLLPLGTDRRVGLAQGTEPCVSAQVPSRV